MLCLLSGNKTSVDKFSSELRSLRWRFYKIKEALQADMPPKRSHRWVWNIGPCTFLRAVISLLHRTSWKSYDPVNFFNCNNDFVSWEESNISMQSFVPFIRYSDSASEEKRKIQEYGRATMMLHVKLLLLRKNVFKLYILSTLCISIGCLRCHEVQHKGQPADAGTSKHDR